MKANELMIGDLVRQWHRYGSGLHDYCEDIKIDGCRMNTIGWEYDGIPITEEMLKENGFECIDKDCCWYKINGFVFYDYEHRSLNYLFNDIGLPICNITYVHELQHALRLCGLNDLADGFKLT